MGSVWQALAFGFAGLSPLGQTLTVDPQLPAAWRALELGLQYHGAAVRIRIEPDVVTFVSDAPVVLEVAGAAVACDAGRTEIPYASPRRCRNERGTGRDRRLGRRSTRAGRCS